MHTLRRSGLTRRSDAVYIQSFETANLRRLNGMVGVRLVQSLDAAGRPYDFTVARDARTYADLAAPAGLAWIAGYADDVGTNKNLIVPRDASGALLAPTTVVADAHAVGLSVHAWTFRAENQFLPVDLRIGVDPIARGDITAEHELLFGLDVDGVFADRPDTAVAVRAAMPRRQQPGGDRRGQVVSALRRRAGLISADLRTPQQAAAD